MSTFTPVRRASLSDVPDLITTFTPFQTSSMSGELRAQTETSAPRYSVRSYQTTIFVVDMNRYRYWFDQSFYSSTTSQHQARIRQAVRELEDHGYKMVPRFD
jgi:hypothetical protein